MVLLDQAASSAGGSIINCIMDQVKGGNLSAITEMVSGKETDASHPMVNNLTPGVTQNLMSQLGLSQGEAKGLASKAIPVVLNMLNGKVKEVGQSGIDIQGLIGQLAGGQKGERGNMLNSVLSILGGSGGTGCGLASLLVKLLGGNKK